MSYIMKAVEADTTQILNFKCAWENVFSESDLIRNNVVLMNKTHKKLLVKMVRARANVSFRGFKNKGLSRAAGKRDQNKLLLLRVKLKGYFEKGKIGNTFDISTEGFQIRIFVRGLGRFQTAQQLLVASQDKRLIFFEDTANIFDSNAVAVNCLPENITVGYVCKEQCTHVVKLINIYNGQLNITRHESDNSYKFEMWIDVSISFKPENREGIYNYLIANHSNELSFKCIGNK